MIPYLSQWSIGHLVEMGNFYIIFHVIPYFCLFPFLVRVQSLLIYFQFLLCKFQIHFVMIQVFV